MKTPLISVVVPMYNVECYIKVCIDSILAQTFQDFEIIIVDDASTDNSYNICKKFYGGNEKVRIVRHEENQGLGPARNTGIEYARGKYIFFVDSDDFILPNALEILYDVAETSGAEIVHASQYYETTQDDDKPLDFDKITLAKDPHQTEGFITTDILYRWENCWQHWEDADGIRSMSWLNFYRSDIFENYPLYFEPIISEDELFAFEIFAYVNKFFVINQPFYIYRQRENSLMNSNNPNRLSQGILALFVSVDKLKAVINRFSKLRGNTEIQEHFTAKLLDAHLFNHIKPFYENGLTQETEFVIDGILQEIFGENKTFVKYFFNLANDLRSKIEKLWAQINQLNGAYHHLLYRHRQTELFLSEQADILKLFDAMKTDAKKIFLLGTPNHGNLGDHAIAAAEYFVLENLFPNHKIIEIPFRYLTGVFGEIFYGLGFEKYVQPDDLIAILGGGNLGNLWVEEESFRRSVIEKFHGNKIIIFPQSVHFTNDEDGQEQLSISEKIYNAHPDLHLMLRDENSFNLANKIFPNINTYLLPDVVTALYGILDNVNVEREGVLFILRSDKEKVRDDSIVENLQEFLTQNNISFNVIDTVINETVYKKNREKKIYDVLMKIRQSRLVITDRFHGVIFSYITRTPVMAFKSFDTKISSGIKWFKDLSSIFYAENATFDDMKNFITQFYNQTLPAQINTNFVANFAEILQAIVPKQEYKTNNLVSRLKFVECLVPISHCNLHCDYCYVIQGNYRDSSMPSFRRTPEEIGLAFKPERWNAQSLFVSFCGAGETLLCKELSDIVRYVLEQGNFVNITTNGTIEKEIEKLINLPSELTRRLVFAFSLHYNELKRKNLLETFAKNVQKVANSDASFLVQLNLYDGYIDYLDEIKEYCIQNFGALPQLVLTRDQTKGMKIHSSHSMEIYRKYGEDFKSSLFEFTCDNFLKKHEDFCFAGEKSYTLQLATGDLRRCYFDSLFFNIYDDLESKVPESPVGYNCKDSYCVNASHFLALGVMPEFKCPSYASLRNRKEGGWYKETIWNALNEKFDCRISDKNLKRGGGSEENFLPKRIWSKKRERVKKLIFLAIPMSICNFRCHYCYLSQRPESYQGVQPEMKYSPEHVAKALSPKRLGGLAYINVCADGETLLTRDIEIYMRRLAEEGHYIEIVTNCTITPVLQKFLAWDKELLAHIEFKCSFHYLELKKRNMLELFAENVNAIWDAGASANVEITPGDELIPYIDEVKNFSLKNFGALPHITIARDDRTKGIEILSKLPKEEYYKIWSQFDSTMFDYKKTVFGKRQEEFCYAGLWSANINLCTGQATACYCGRSLGDVFANPDSDFPTFPVGKCSIAHCYNAHAFMTLGNIPHSTKITFADIRNRVRTDGREWLNPKLKKFFGTQLFESNDELSDVEKFNFMTRNILF